MTAKVSARALGGAVAAATLLFTLAACGKKAEAPVEPAAAPAPAPIIVEGFSSPESVVIGADGRVFVSNLGPKLEPLAKDGDGTISELSADGKIVNIAVFPAAGDAKLDAPKGLIIVDGILYTTDIDRVVGFDLAKGKQSFVATFKPAKKGATVFLNDIIGGPNGTLLVSDTAGGTALSLDPKTGKFTTLATGMNGPNGFAIAPGATTGTIVAMGAGFEGAGVYSFDLTKAGPATLLPPVTGLLDGAAVLPSGDTIVSDWVSFTAPANAKLRILAADGTQKSEHELAGVNGAADFALSADGKTLFIPAMPMGKVFIMPVPN